MRSYIIRAGVFHNIKKNSITLEIILNSENNGSKVLKFRRNFQINSNQFSTMALFGSYLFCN